jgi:hypothetical protein
LNSNIHKAAIPYLKYSLYLTYYTEKTEKIHSGSDFFVKYPFFLRSAGTADDASDKSPVQDFRQLRRIRLKKDIKSHRQDRSLLEKSLFLLYFIS